MPRMGQIARAAARKGLRAGGLDVRRPPASLLERPEAQLAIDLEHLIARRLLEGTDLFVVQIGAFDGRSGDQLHDWIVRYRWRGILVEPQPRYFAQLQRTYADLPGLDLRSVAISDRRETRALYTIRDGVPGLPDWAPQIASFDRALVDAHGLRGPLGQDVVECHRVECLPFADLLVDVDRVDLLQVDAEGYDADIIRMFQFESYRPTIVRFESKHLARSDHDSAIKRLLEYGYSVAVPGDDTIGWYQD